MKVGIWPILMLALFLNGCAAGGYSGYEPYPYGARPYYEERPGYRYYEPPPPLPVSPEVLGSRPGDHHPAFVS
jgi:hypothetical protein